MSASVEIERVLVVDAPAPLLADAIRRLVSGDRLDDLEAFH